MPSPTKVKRVKAWGGFSGDKLHDTMEYYGDHLALKAIYVRKVDARKCYEDVRPVFISFGLPTNKKPR